MANSLEKYPFAERILFSADQRVVENHSNYSDRGNALSDHVPRRENEYACRELIRRANESFEVDTRDLSMPWLPGIGIVYVCASCWNVTRLKAIFRARECVIPFRFDNELFWKFFFLPFSFQSFKHLIESFDAIISFGNFNKSDFILWYIIFL